MENRLAGIATNDEEGERRNRDQRETRRYQRVTRSWEGKMVLGRRRSHQVQRTGTLNCRLVHETTPPLLLYKSVYNLF